MSNLISTLRHGFSRRGKLRRPEHIAWCEMRHRCSNPKHKFYYRYGGRGITVCARWSVFENFLADMGLRPSKFHSLNRKDNDGPYSPDNCEWATKREQANNRGSTHWLEFNGQRHSIADWARILNVTYETISLRLSRGWSVQRTLTEPRRKNQYG